jgi:hypothetical protein
MVLERVLNYPDADLGPRSSVWDKESDPKASILATDAFR